MFRTIVARRGTMDGSRDVWSVSRGRQKVPRTTKRHASEFASVLVTHEERCNVQFVDGRSATHPKPTRLKIHVVGRVRKRNPRQGTQELPCGSLQRGRPIRCFLHIEQGCSVSSCSPVCVSGRISFMVNSYFCARPTGQSGVGLALESRGPAAAPEKGHPWGWMLNRLYRTTACTQHPRCGST